MSALLKRLVRSVVTKMTNLRTADRRRVSELGDTLVEVLVALAVIGIASVALFGGFATSVTSSAEHRSLATLDTVLKSYAETATYQIQQQVNPLYANCPTSYTLNPSFTVPPGVTGYTPLPITSIQYWVPLTSSFTTHVSQCVAGAPQMLTVSATGPNHTQESLNFIVDDPGSVAPSGPTPLSVTTTSLASAQVGQTGYSQTLAAAGGTTPYSWSITSGSLPSTLSLNGSTGVISGNVSSSAMTGTFAIQVQVTDSNHSTATKSLSITVTSVPVPLSVTTASLAAAEKGQIAYSQTLAAAGGTTPYSWSITSGSLPSTLSLNGSTGVISGNVSGTAVGGTFTVRVADALGATATKSLSITVNSGPSVSTTSLAGGHEK